MVSSSSTPSAKVKRQQERMMMTNAVPEKGMRMPGNVVLMEDGELMSYAHTLQEQRRGSKMGESPVDKINGLLIKLYQELPVNKEKGQVNLTEKFRTYDQIRKVVDEVRRRRIR